MNESFEFKPAYLSETVSPRNLIDGLRDSKHPGMDVIYLSSHWGEFVTNFSDEEILELFELLNLKKDASDLAQEKKKLVEWMVQIAKAVKDEEKSRSAFGILIQDVLSSYDNDGVRAQIRAACRHALDI